MMQMNAQLSLLASNNAQFCMPPSQIERSGNGYDVTDTPVLPFRSNIKAQMHELTRIALQGCDLGENIALSHQKRPCFKKIDSLCARLKQDLLRPDNVLANINSQGVAWAVKDFIFVFTRIINAWIIIKDYANNRSEGLQKVRSAFASNFNESFEKWQDSTVDFIDQIIKSFHGLDDLVQSQRTNFGANKDDHNMSNSSNDSLNGLTSPSMSSNGTKNGVNVLVNSETAHEKHNEAGTYFKTGVYEPLLKRKTADLSPRDSDLVLEDLHECQDYHESVDKFCARQSQLEENAAKGGVDLDEYSKMSVLKSIWTKDALHQDCGCTWDYYLLDKILNLKEGEYFFTSQFMENYVSR